MLAAKTTQGESAQPMPQSRELASAAHLDILYRLTDKLYRANGTEPMFDAALEAITDGLGCEKCSILLFDPEGVMRFVAWRGFPTPTGRSWKGTRRGNRTPSTPCPSSFPT